MGGRVVVDGGEQAILVILDTVKQGVVDFDESQHGRIYLLEVYLFLLVVINYVASRRCQQLKR